MVANRKTILIVDDDEVILRVLERDLGQAGFAVVKAGNGKEALEIVSRDTVDIVISDISMPEMDGLAFCEQLRRRPDLRGHSLHLPHGSRGRAGQDPGSAIGGGRLRGQALQHGRSHRARGDPLRPHPAKTLRGHLEGQPARGGPVRDPAVVRVDAETRRAPRGRGCGEGDHRVRRRHIDGRHLERSSGRGRGARDVRPDGRQFPLPVARGVLRHDRTIHQFHAHGGGAVDRRVGGLRGPYPFRARHSCASRSRSKGTTRTRIRRAERSPMGAPTSPPSSERCGCPPSGLGSRSGN